MIESSSGRFPPRKQDTLQPAHAGSAAVDLKFPEEAERFRGEVRAFLERALPRGWRGLGALPDPEVEPFLCDWRAVLHREGLLAISWPTEYGGAGLSPTCQVVLHQEFARARAPTGGRHDRFGITMLGNTLLRWGSGAQKREFLPRTLSGEMLWCQGYSEPGAGSDLANVSCSAERDGDEWVIHGQKTWTSLGDRANWIFLLVRTDAAAPKHRGLSFLLCPLDGPGVAARPIRMANGQREFCDVFFDGARTATGNLVGEVNAGWAVANTLLEFERGEAAATFPILFRHELERLVELAVERGRGADPLVRQRLAWCREKVDVMQWLGYRALTGLLRGAEPGAASSISKLYWSEYHREVTDLALEILGPDAMVPAGRAPRHSVRSDDPGAPNSSASWVGTWLNARAGTIYAGSSEIQRNILAERVLGLPRDPG
jgi:alkylation response protein AidB-like acyl-CoA dehydrogenase